MSSLFKKSKAFRDTALFQKQQFRIDEGFMALTCYSAAQAIELGIKYLLEISGLRYDTDHNIEHNLRRLRDNCIPYPKNLNDISEMLTLWNNSSRYQDAFISTEEKVNRALNVYQELELCILNAIADKAPDTPIPDEAAKTPGFESMIPKNKP